MTIRGRLIRNGAFALLLAAAPVAASPSCPDFSTTGFPWKLTFEDGLGDVVAEAATAWAVVMHKFDGSIFVDTGRRVYEPDRNLWFQRTAPGAVHVAVSRTGSNNVNLSCRDSKHWVQVDASLPADKLLQVVAHEIGHALIAHKGRGTGHIDDGVSIMRANPAGTCPNRSGLLSEADIREVSGVVSGNHVEPVCDADNPAIGPPYVPPPPLDDDGTDKPGSDVKVSETFPDLYGDGYRDGYGAGYGDGFAAPRRACSADGATLDLHGGAVSGRVEVFDVAASPHVVPEMCSDESGVFSFYGPDNWELMVKVLDGCAINGHWWVFASGATDREWLLTVERGEDDWQALGGGPHRRTWTDTEAFACE